MREGHATEGQTVLCLQFLYIGLTALGSHFEQVGLRGHSFVHGLLHIALKLHQQGVVLVRQFLLMRYGNHAPIGLINFVDQVIVRSFRTDIGYFLRRLGDLVHLRQTATQIDRLRDTDLRYDYMLHVDGQGVVQLLITSCNEITYSVLDSLNRILQDRPGPLCSLLRDPTAARPIERRITVLVHTRRS